MLNLAEAVRKLVFFVQLCKLLQVVELTREGVEFLEQRFAQFDKDGDGRLSPAEQDDMFACAPSRCMLELTPTDTPCDKDCQEWAKSSRSANGQFATSSLLCL